MSRTFFALYIVVALNYISSVIIFYANISCMKQLMNEIIIYSKTAQNWLLITNVKTYQLIWIRLMIYTSILTNNHHTWSTNFYCFISHAFITQWYTKEEHECDIFSQLFLAAASFHSLTCWGHEFTILAVSDESLQSVVLPKACKWWIDIFCLPII